MEGVWQVLTTVPGTPYRMRIVMIFAPRTPPFMVSSFPPPPDVFKDLLPSEQWL